MEVQVNAKAEMADYEARAEAAYIAAPHNVKNLYEDACLCLARR
jgi:hypothetical protein